MPPPGDTRPDSYALLMLAAGTIGALARHTAAALFGVFAGLALLSVCRREV